MKVTVSIQIILLGFLFLLYAWNSHTVYQNFLANGKEVQGKIFEKKKRSAYIYDVRVAFTDKTLLERGVKFRNISVTGSLWDKLKIDTVVTVLFLPNTLDFVLKASTMPENMAPIEMYDVAFYTIGIGLMIFLVNFVYLRLLRR